MPLLIRIEDKEGQTVDFHGGDEPIKWIPLQVDDFYRCIVNREPMPLAAQQAQITFSGPTESFASSGNVELVFSPQRPIQVFGLVLGGWLPAAMCESTLLLPDANLAGSFSLMEDEAARVRAQFGQPEVTMLSAGSTRISGLLAASESVKGAFPSKSEFADRMRTIARRLARGFPTRDIMVPNHESISVGFKALEEDFPRYARYREYLSCVFPLISHRVADAMLSQRHTELNAFAERHRVSQRSFLHMLVLDCLYDDGPKPKREQRPGRLVLKPKKVFKNEDLFNALSDVMHMERLCQLHMHTYAEYPVMVTMDQGLAMAWAMLSPYKIQAYNGDVIMRFRLNDAFALRLQGSAREDFAGQLQS